MYILMLLLHSRWHLIQLVDNVHVLHHVLLLLLYCWEDMKLCMLHRWLQQGQEHLQIELLCSMQLCFQMLW